MEVFVHLCWLENEASVPELLFPIIARYHEQQLKESDGGCILITFGSGYNILVLLNEGSHDHVSLSSKVKCERVDLSIVPVRERNGRLHRVEGVRCLQRKANKRIMRHIHHRMVKPAAVDDNDDYSVEPLICLDAYKGNDEYIKRCGRTSIKHES